MEEDDFEKLLDKIIEDKFNKITLSQEDLLIIMAKVAELMLENLELKSKNKELEQKLYDDENTTDDDDFDFDSFINF